MLAAGGCAWLAGGLASPGARFAPFFTLGLVTIAAAPALVGHALLVVEAERRRVADRVVTGALYMALVGLLGIGPALLYDPAAGGCSECPANLLELADGDDLAPVLSKVGRAVGVL